MNLKTIALVAALSASPFATQPLAAQQTVYRPVAEARAEAPLALDKALADTSAAASRYVTTPSFDLASRVSRFNAAYLTSPRTAYDSNPTPHIEHPKHEKHLPLDFYQFRPSFDTRNTPIHEYEALIHTPPLGKRGLLHHIEAEFGLMLATEPHAHYDHGHRTYRLATQPGIVIGFKIH